MKKYFVAILFIANSFLVAQQVGTSELRARAIENMKTGRYGEAITLLNKYIAQKPQDPEGYHLVALCQEKRKEFESARLNMRRAIALKEDDAVFRTELERIINTWYAILEKKIEGHKREIAIDSKNPANYLGIANSYRWMEKWALSEQWYDEYLVRDPNASPDEIIRFTNVLVELKKLKKAEDWLKIYVERYPSDWRLWSRLGYMQVWQGKHKEAVPSFENSLKIKPFFKEAEEGLDLAQKNAYLYHQIDADDRGRTPVPQEYAIDRYYRILKSRPNESETRFLLVEELVKVNRFEEAYTELLKLKPDFSDSQRFIDLWSAVTQIREKAYNDRIADAELKLSNDPFDKDALLMIAKNYENLEQYDEAIGLFDAYFENRPDESDTRLLYMYSRLLAWFKDFDLAVGYMDKALAAEPENVDFLLFRGQLSVWTNSNLEKARGFILQAYQKRPRDLSVLLTLASLETNENNFDDAERYIAEARKVDPMNPEIIKLESNLEFHKLRFEEERLFGILEEGRNLVNEGKYDKALPFYEKYLDEAEPNKLIKKEYGDIQFRAKNYPKALEIYNSLLAQSMDETVLIQRGQLFFEMEDDENAINDFRKLVELNPNNFMDRVYLGDAYSKAEMWEQAEAQYDTAASFQPDSAQFAILKQRRSWVPARGLDAIIQRFPTSVRFAPVYSFFSDNAGFSLRNFGGIVELGINDFLTFAVSLYRNRTKGTIAIKDFTTFKWHLFVKFSPMVSGGFSMGSITSLNSAKQRETDVFLRVAKDELWSIQGNYLNTDAGLMLYSPYLITIEGVRKNSTMYKLAGIYRHPYGIKFDGLFQYLSIPQIDGSDLTENAGNTLVVRISREFLEDIETGYEYFYSNFRFSSAYYYSPIGFESHSVFANFHFRKEDVYKAVVGGKLGYIFENEYVLTELFAEGQYQIFPGLALLARIGTGSSSRDGVGYTSSSGYVGLSWMIR